MLLRGMRIPEVRLGFRPFAEFCVARSPGATEFCGNQARLTRAALRPGAKREPGVDEADDEEDAASDLPAPEAACRHRVGHERRPRRYPSYGDPRNEESRLAEDPGQWQEMDADDGQDEWCDEVLPLPPGCPERQRDARDHLDPEHYDIPNE